ncbi:MAG: hypothetical protein ACNA8K_03515 [Cyclonatronaceae bacterium]
MKKWIIGILVATLLFLFGFALLLLSTLDETDLELAAENVLGPDFSVEIGSARVTPFTRAIRMGDIRVSAAADGHLIFVADTLIMSGIDLMGLTRSRLSLSTLEMTNFTIDWSDELIANGEGGKTGSDTSAVINGNDGNGILKKVTIRDIDIINGNLILREAGQIRSQYNTINLKGGFDTGLMTAAGAVKDRSAGIEIDSLGFQLSDNRYRFSLKNFTFTQNTGLLSLASLKLIPVGGYEQYMASLEYRTDMFEVEIKNLTVREIDDRAFIEDNTIKAGMAEADTFNLHVTTNIQLPKNPESSPPPLLNEKIQRLPYDLQLDAVIVHKGNISYSEQAGDGFRPGTVSFSNSTVRVSNVNSRSNEPAVLIAATYLQNHAELNTELRFSLGDGPFAMSGTGSLNRFDVTQLNSIFMDVAGIEVTSGMVHELSFRFGMAGNKSSGQMHLVYEDLKVKSIDKDDYRGGISRSVISLLANQFAIRSDNMPDSDGMVKEGVIEHERNPGEDPFFKYLWQTLRSGLFDILMKL